MPDPRSKPGPADGSGLLVAALAGVVVALLLYFLLFWVHSPAADYTIVPYVVAGAVAGLAVGLLRRRAGR